MENVTVIFHTRLTEKLSMKLNAGKSVESIN